MSWSSAHIRQPRFLDDPPLLPLAPVGSSWSAGLGMFILVTATQVHDAGYFGHNWLATA